MHYVSNKKSNYVLDLDSVPLYLLHGLKNNRSSNRIKQTPLKLAVSGRRLCGRFLFLSITRIFFPCNTNYNPAKGEYEFIQKLYQFIQKLKRTLFKVRESYNITLSQLHKVPEGITMKYLISPRPIK